ncbi:hypothetical protein B0A48_08532 [Cryoendolithus antarcticus]|uniref:Zn(2)-C6 fungal-type domain-containing protein n=1 Tax=Cryoendolithus antarcticus TaxID=1507870 RepID=A0A1V8T624_9PEZI|nr:hypothetical protein B0A48_08532 [Cryoendolithus antarcticus]
MPGILPMKVIKVGVNAQTRIAQACDRCRSKKIRCDGVRPCCSQCSNVGFECKTSDKLSRRAFPRGYTESLEERVRSLESEVRELKDLLDEKDEKIDMLSRIHSQSSYPIQLPSPRRPSVSPQDSATSKDEPDPDETFKVQQSPYLLGEGTDSYFAGTSSGRTFIEAFKMKVAESGRSKSDINTEFLLASSLRKRLSDASSTPATPVVWRAPPRMVSDQLINIFFQEWAPMFPVLHKPTFLTLYEKYVADPDSVTDKAEVAQLNLVFGVASLSSGTRASEDLSSFESQWKSALDNIITENCMATLQALILAQLYAVQLGDLTRLLTYKGLATSLSARLGLHQSQKRFALGTLTCETRKKVFWSLYTVDCFTSVILGLPKHIKNDDVHCEYPVDADDEYVTERGFQPTLPGESTRVSSALALFRAARILSKVLEEVFPAKASYDLSLKKLAELSDELDTWQSSLAPHLRLQFVQDKPSTGTVSSRSPLLSLIYHYIRCLIHRPAICASIGNKSSSSMLAHSSSCKSMIQIIQLLEERNLSFSFCLNKDEVLVLCGFGLLFQRLRLDPNSKMLKDNQKMLVAVADVLSKSAAPCAPEFQKVSKMFLPPPPTSIASDAVKIQSALAAKLPVLSRHNSETTTQHSQSLHSSTKKQLKAIASRFTASAATRLPNLGPSTYDRRSTVHNISLHPHPAHAQSQPSLSPLQSYTPINISRSEPAQSPHKIYSRPASTMGHPSDSHIHAPPPQQPKPKKRSFTQQTRPNLDYLSFGPEPDASAQKTVPSPPVKTEPQPTDWEKLLGSLDSGPTNIYDACYGGQAVETLLDGSPPTIILRGSNTALAQDANLDWNSDLWALCQTTTNSSTATSGMSGNNGHPGSIWSFSTDEGTGSSEDLSATEWGSNSGVLSAGDGYKAIMLPELGLDELGYPGAGWETLGA